MLIEKNVFETTKIISKEDFYRKAIIELGISNYHLFNDDYEIELLNDVKESSIEHVIATVKYDVEYTCLVNYDRPFSGKDNFTKQMLFLSDEKNKYDYLYVYELEKYYYYNYYKTLRYKPLFESKACDKTVIVNDNLYNKTIMENCKPNYPGDIVTNVSFQKIETKDLSLSAFITPCYSFKVNNKNVNNAKEDSGWIISTLPIIKDFNIMKIKLESTYNGIHQLVDEYSAKFMNERNFLSKFWGWLQEKGDKFSDFCQGCGEHHYKYGKKDRIEKIIKKNINLIINDQIDKVNNIFKLNDMNIMNEKECSYFKKSLKDAIIFYLDRGLEYDKDKDFS